MWRTYIWPKHASTTVAIPYHFILSEGAGFIGHEVANSPQLLRNGGAASDGFWDSFISLNHEGVCCLTHV